MASFSFSLSLPSSSLPRSWEHDVFLSFHGPDVRKGFLSHMLKEFERKGIMPFIDNNIKRGESIAPELKRAIQESKIAVVLLSKNYASSSWCLDELVEIMSKVVGQTVLTIFYEVDPTDIKKQTGDFGKAFSETCQKLKEKTDENCQGKTKEKIETWTKALEEVATIAGYHSKDSVNEVTMIEKIAANISIMLNHLAPSHDLDRFVGMRAHIEKMQQLLRLDLEDEVRMVGICGPRGTGKTTIARILFNEFSKTFPLSAIMENIKKNYPRDRHNDGRAQLDLQNQMLSQMLNQKDIMITHLGVAKERLKDRKVLLVLDDVDKLVQLDALAGDIRWFGPGSRIIITTKDLRVLQAGHGINHIYSVDHPTAEEALQIFCMHAFGQQSPPDGFEELAQKVIKIVGKVSLDPAELRDAGTFFRGTTKEEWKARLLILRGSIWCVGGLEKLYRFYKEPNSGERTSHEQNP